MGCDIHMYVEYKKEFKSQGITKWISGDYFKQNPDKGIYEDEPDMDRMELYGSRNYALFSTLAGVRDYSGEIEPVSEPKGIPDDCCEYIKTQCEDYECDGHTHSWLTLKELKEYQSQSPILTQSGLISPEAVIKFDKEGILPNEWCQGTNMEGYERRIWNTPNKELIPLIDLLHKRAHELMQYDWQEYDPKNDENCRIVFWFDN